MMRACITLSVALSLMQAAPTSGTARISGRAVTLEANEQPVRRAIVTLTGAGLPGGRTTITDAEGRFTFERLPAGRFLMTATKRGYVNGAYGSTRPGRAGVPIQIAAGESRTNIVVGLARGAVISGVLRNDMGEPAAGINVTAYTLPPPANAGGAGIRNELIPVKSATTDDRGAYRLYGLPPGKYIVASTLHLGGVAGEIGAPSTQQVDDLLLRLARRSSGNAQPGEAAIRPPKTDVYAYTPVLFPGTTVPGEATVLSVNAGEEREGINFSVRLMRVATLEGSLTTGGTPATALIISRVGLQLPEFGAANPIYWTRDTPSGKLFKFTNVLPGHYRITAQSTAPGVAWSRTELDVTGSDISGIALVMQPGLKLSGRVVFEPGQLAPPSDVSGVGLRLSSIHGSGVGTSGGYTRVGNAVIPPGKIESDGRFEIAGIIPDVYHLSATVPAPAGWWLRSAVINGVDVLDHRFEIGGGGDVTGAVFTFSDRRTMLSGTLLKTTGQPGEGLFIAVFPADRSMWRPMARRIQSARAGTDGRWIVEGLPAGEYLVAALTDLIADDLYESSFLEALVPGAVKVSLADGQQKTQDLRIGG